MTEIYTRAFALWLNVTKLMVCLRLKNKTWMIFRNYSWKDRICSTDTSIVNRWPGPHRFLLCIILKVELYMLTFWLVLTYNLLEDRHINASLTLFLSPYYIKQVDSMLPCVFLVIETSKEHQWHTRLSLRVALFCSNRILTSSVIYYWTDTRQPGIYLLITQSS